jgi:short-subunit dehydrogenase
MKVIVTGASKGIGKSVAEIFAADGHDLFICSQNEVNLYKAKEDLGTRFPNVNIHAKAFDLSKKEEVIKFGEWCLLDASPHILVNNAGLFEPGNVHDEAEGVMESQMAINFYSAFHLTRTILPSMMKKKRGHIFNICSIASIGAYKNGGAYSVSKFALYGFSKNLREEMKPHQIKVTAIIAGAVLTDSWGGFDNTENRIMVSGDIAQMILAASKLSPGACVEDIILRPQLGDL